MNGTGRVGFVIDSQVPSWAAVRGRKAHPWAPLTGWPGSGSVARMRFGWIADRVNAEGGGGALHYEIYKPWRRYAAVVFLKSMGAECAALAERLRDAGTRVVFDLNVDYLTPADGRFYYEGMAPTPEQHAAALAMVKLADLVIADSSHLAAVAARQHANVAWVADNVEMRLAPAWRAWRRTGKLPLLWSGEAAKLFELLAIESAQIAFGYGFDWVDGLDLVFDGIGIWLGLWVAGLLSPFRRFFPDTSALERQSNP